jgi:ubiquinone/menaquinone biosynthesis C-methylase UbiE
MSTPHSGEYALATGEAAVRRLNALHRIYGPAGKRALLQAGLGSGMKVADFGCGVGMVTQMLADIVGPAGHVTGVDVSGDQLKQAEQRCHDAGLGNVSFVEASATTTGLSRASFDFVYCRFLLLHLTDPAACLREMRDVLKPGGTLVVEDGDLAAAHSVPPSAIDHFADLVRRLGSTRGLDYSMSRNLYQLVRDAGFPVVDIEIHQPAVPRGETRFLLKWSIDEAGPGCVAAGLLSADDLQRTLADMQRDTEDESILIFMPPMSQVWARKPSA